MSYYSVYPRYTPGSPAQVDKDLAMKVADDERSAFDLARYGRYSTQAAARAYLLGVRGIAVKLTEKRGRLIALDLITDEEYFWEDAIGRRGGVPIEDIKFITTQPEKSMRSYPSTVEIQRRRPINLLDGYTRRIMQQSRTASDDAAALEVPGLVNARSNELRAYASSQQRHCGEVSDAITQVVHLVRVVEGLLASGGMPEVGAAALRAAVAPFKEQTS